MASTSFHSMNSDRFHPDNLSRINRKLWIISFFLLNRINNLLPMTNVDPNLELRDFTRKNIREEITELRNFRASPSRMLSDLFWKQLNWEQLEQELENLIIADFGCGSGEYGKLFYEFSGERVQHYYGFDYFQQQHWATLTQENPYMSFSQFDASTQKIVDILENSVSIITSQSAIEHFDEDLSFFQNIRDFVVHRNKPTVQVHLFPSAACLDLYRTHGMRQYTPRNVSKITRLFSDFSTCILYRLGNKPSIDLHLETITRPMYYDKYDYRTEKTDEYVERTIQAFEQDMAQPITHAGFYGLIIHSYPKSQIDYIR